VVLAPLALGAVLAQLTAAIRIDLGQHPVSVEASYRFTPATDTAISFVLIRLPGQTIEGPDHHRVEHLGGLTRIHGVPDQTGEVAIRFRVAGDRARIPIPVPSIPAGRGAVEIRLSGADGIAVSEAFPRLAATGEGVFSARLGAIPSVVQLPSRTGPPLLRWLDWLVVGMVAAATAGWVARRRRERGPP
jgi:hypothetical protein